jgi:hypothetical protein
MQQKPSLFSTQYLPQHHRNTMIPKRPQHEKLPKDLAPERGGTYALSMTGTGAAAYEAEIVKYGGGCWATVRVTNPLENARHYKVGDTFDIRVAMYEFARLAEA